MSEYVDQINDILSTLRVPAVGDAYQPCYLAIREGVEALTAARDALRILENKGMEEAHMAGQADAGVDPSWSNAQAWVRDYLAAKELQQLSPTPEQEQTNGGSN